MNGNLLDFSKAQVLIIGDVMLDRYWHGVTERISPEAPVPVVHVQTKAARPGGAANVALNTAVLGAKTTLVGSVGDDVAADEIQANLTAVDVNCCLYRDTTQSTIIKLRVLSQHQQLIRLDFEQANFKINHSKLLDLYSQQLNHNKIIVISDYGKNTFGNQQDIIQLAQAANIPILADPKGRDFSIYRGVSLLTPNFKEFKAVVGDCADEMDLVTKAQNLIQHYQLGALLITRGSEGMTLIRKNQAAVYLPARAREVYDVTGAGDTVIATLATALSSGCDLVDAAELANKAAGIAVSKLGAAAVSVSELRRFIWQEQASTGILTQEKLLTMVADAKAHGEKIVMTNGCFDILHAGHVTYLEQARSLGDRLIVAINDDASVKRLKGVGRPVNPLDRRMQVLVGLASVDWVVPFSQDTPAELIAQILPDVLVKGGDYRPEQIAGGDAVLAAGGEIKILPFVPGCATSQIIDYLHSLKREK